VKSQRSRRGSRAVKRPKTSVLAEGDCEVQVFRDGTTVVYQVCHGRLVCVGGTHAGVKQALQRR
jgi:hypothetical protein